MSERSFPQTSLTRSDTTELAGQIQESIQTFLNWLDSVEIQSKRTDQSGRNDRSVGRGNNSFINGPYAEIKESIVRIQANPGKFYYKDR